jgi:hypothetical protein
MSGTSLKSIIFGFIAGALATVTVQALINYLLSLGGIGVPWSVEPIPGFDFPPIVFNAALGGLWGIVFALILGDVPKGSMTLKGALLGILGPALVGVFVLVPILTSKIPLFFNGDVNLIWPMVVILAGFGAATAWLYGFMTSGFRLP